MSKEFKSGRIRIVHYDIEAVDIEFTQKIMGKKNVQNILMGEEDFADLIRCQRKMLKPHERKHERTKVRRNPRKR